MPPITQDQKEWPYFTFIESLTLIWGTLEMLWMVELSRASKKKKRKKEKSPLDFLHSSIYGLSAHWEHWFRVVQMESCSQRTCGSIIVLLGSKYTSDYLFIYFFLVLRCETCAPTWPGPGSDPVLLCPQSSGRRSRRRAATAERRDRTRPSPAEMTSTSTTTRSAPGQVGAERKAGLGGGGSFSN